jgi:fatty acid desaturase
MTEYAELKRRLRSGGVFQRQLRYYGLQAVLSVALLAFPFALLLISPPVWLQLIAAGLLAVAFTRLAFIFHDAGHRQVFGRPWQNDCVMLLMGFLTGSSTSWWFKTHNQHHCNPNDLDLDPSTALPILVFSEEQARERSGPLKSVLRFQAYYFLPLLCLEAMGARLASLLFLITGKAKYPLIEAPGMVAHFVIYGSLMFILLPAEEALLFMLVHQCLFGFYMGSVFAPNHKGMPIPTATTRLNFFNRQIRSSRNITPSPIGDFWLGGLNYQIEHHLFPNIPRNKLKEARAITRHFCLERSIPYYETSVWRAYAEVLRYLHRVVAPLRNTGRVREEVRQNM